MPLHDGSSVAAVGWRYHLDDGVAHMTQTLESRTVDAYRTFALQTTPHSRAIYLLHEKCIYLINQSLHYSEKREQLLTRAQNILAQLQSALVEEDPLSDGLHCLYDYAYVRLEAGGDTSLEQAREVLLPLKEAFGLLIRQPV